MNIIIPLGGIGKRFSDVGYLKPKPLIKVSGKEIIFWLLDNLKINKIDKIFIPYNEYLDDFHFDEVVKVKYPNIHMLSIEPTNGPAETLKICINHFNIDGKIIILDGDTWYNEDILKKVRNINNNASVFFNSIEKPPLYSYLLLDDNNIIIDIKEKVKISDNANVGCYVFNNTKNVLKHIDLISKEGEKYISDIIKSMILDNYKFDGLLINDFHVLGTPQQIVNFSKYYLIEPKRFVFDLDNTLVTYPKILGDYSSVLPIQKTINYLKKLKEQNHYIIIYTARRMRTHNGNVGALIADIGAITINTLKNFDIPYDELCFGKPYGHYYIDDLMINPKSDLNKELGFYMENVEPRDFNSLVFNESEVKKTSNMRKLMGEAHYYITILSKSEISEYFPKLISMDDNSITMERFNGSNFSIFYINEILTTEHLDLLFNTIKKIHKFETKSKFDKYYDYNEKIENRFINYDFTKYGLSTDEQNDILNSVKHLKGEYNIIHGDLVFSNILFTTNGEIKFVDVKGMQGNDFSIYGDKYYDFSKIYQSLIGYDEILLDKPISNAYRRKMVTHFENYFKPSELEKIKKITKSLLVTLIPLHNNYEKNEKYIKLAKKIIK